MKISRQEYQEMLNKHSKPTAKTHHNKPEAQITLSILKYLKMKGYATGKIKTVGGRIGNKFIFDRWQWTGLPDILCFMPKLVFIEVKAKSRQSDQQKWFQELCQKAGITYFLVYSLEELMDRIIELEERQINDHPQQ